MRRVVVALVHHPVLDQAGAIVTSAITNLDVHDIARSACTYGVSDYFLVHPIDAQRALVQKIKDHWLTGAGGRRIPPRKDAIALVRLVSSLDEVYSAMGGRAAVEVWVTSAKASPNTVRAADARNRTGEGKPIVILFGTAWGLAQSVMEDADVRIAPLGGASPWNHLSVRAAAAILLDRLFGA